MMVKIYSLIRIPLMNYLPALLESFKQTFRFPRTQWVQPIMENGHLPFWLW